MKRWTHEELCEMWRESKRKAREWVQDRQPYFYALDCEGRLDLRRDETWPTVVWFNEMDERYGEGEE